MRRILRALKWTAVVVVVLAMTVKSRPVPVFVVKPATSTPLPWVSTATEFAASELLAVPLRICCQSRVPSPANFTTVKSAKSAPVKVFRVEPAASTLPSVSTAIEFAPSGMKVTGRACRQSRVPLGANFTTMAKHPREQRYLTAMVY